MSERPAGAFPILEMGALIEQAGDNPARAAKIVADNLWAQGYRKPRTITTAEELDALPDMTILVDQHGIAWQKFVDEESDQPYWAMDGIKCYQASTVLETRRRQLTVLWTPN